ncbi:MAG: hypothetical protein IIA65_08965 [Planctomycetes bacterium]|nr:hypothetical protein [Planctomycetota bacterium]
MLIQEPVGEFDLASSGLFSAWLHPAASTIKPTSPASPSLPGENSGFLCPIRGCASSLKQPKKKWLALGPTTEFSDRLRALARASSYFLQLFAVLAGLINAIQVSVDSGGSILDNSITTRAFRVVGLWVTAVQWNDTTEGTKQ